MSKEPDKRADEQIPNRQAAVRPGFFAELKRRKVFRVAITYAVVAWLIIQVASATFSGFGIPEWAFRFVVIVILLGFPIALIITWAVELTPEGVKLTSHVTASDRAHSSQRKRNWLAFAFAAGLPTVLFGTLAAFFFFTRSAPKLDAVELDKSIAVLPFRNVSADASNEYFCDGVHDDILTTLANIGDMQVISRTSVMRYKNSEKTIPEIGDELGVAYILEGSVQRSGNRVRVTGQLINARTDEHLWAKNYDRDLDDIFALQAEISKEIAGSLKAVLTPEEAARIEQPATVHPAAYDLVLKGRSLKGQVDLPLKEELTRSSILYQAALEMQHDYLDAWVELANIRLLSYFNFVDRSPEFLEQAKMALVRAKELNPNDVQVLIATGNFHYYGHQDYDRAREYYQQALSRTPNNAMAYASLAYISRREGKWADTGHYFKKAHELDPNNLELADNYLNFLQGTRQHAKAAELGEHLYRLDPDVGFGYLRWKGSEAMAANDPKRLETFFSEYSPEQIQSDSILYSQNLILNIQFGHAQAFINLWESGFPDGFDPNFWKFRESYAVALRMVDRESDAVAVIKDLKTASTDHLEKNPDNMNALVRLAFCHAFLGEREPAMNIVDGLLAVNREIDQLRYLEVLETKFECLHILGDIEGALDTLEESISRPFGLHLYHLPDQMRFYRLRGHPRFEKMKTDPKNGQPLI